MTDYIKREPRTFIEIADDLNDLLNELNDKIVESIWAKTADVATVRHGRWEDEFKEDAPMFVKHRYVCTACNNWQTYGKTAYCPNCGAKMDR